MEKARMKDESVPAGAPASKKQENYAVNFLHDHKSYGVPEDRQRRRFFLIGLVALVFLLFGVFLWVWPSAPTEDMLTYDPVTLQPQKPAGFFRRITNFVFSREDELTGEKEDRINILLLGMGGAGHDGPYLTDTLLLVSIQPSTKRVALVSIPRDTQVNIPGYGWYKINHANAFGEVRQPGSGAAFATKVVSDTFGIDIPYYVRLDFEAFQDIIDEVGGIRVNVERSFVDTQYPAPKFAYQTISFQKGIQVMKGVRALQYARSRHGTNGEGSDFARARRQQKMLLAVKEKVLSFSTLANPIRVNNILQTLDTHLSTNFSFGDILTILKLGKELETDELISLVLDTSPTGYLRDGVSTAGGFILVPKSGTFDEISGAIKYIFSSQTITVDDTPPQDRPPMSTSTLEIQNGTWRAGLAARIKKRLTDKQFVVQTLGNVDERPIAESGIYAVTTGVPSEALSALAQELRIPVKVSVPSGIHTATTTDILILLGEDMKE